MGGVKYQMPCVFLKILYIILQKDKLECMFVFCIASGGRILLKDQTLDGSVQSNKLEVYIHTHPSVSLHGECGC